MKKISERQKLLVTDLIAEKGLNRYVTNIAKSELSDQDVVDYYHDLWHMLSRFANSCGKFTRLISSMSAPARLMSCK